MECKNLSTCNFVKCCEESQLSTSAHGFINMYCKGNRMKDCVRLRLCEKFGKQVVPKNMMPNGSPLPSSTKEGWSIEALNYLKLI